MIKKRITIIVSFIFVLYACEPSTKQVEQTEVKKSDTYVSHNLDTLSQLLDLTVYKPKSVLWTIKKPGNYNGRNPGPTDYKLQAILTFEDTTIARLKSSYKLLSITYMPKNLKPFTFDWLPQNYTFSQDSTFDITCRPDFFKKSPYLNGAFITNNNDVLLNFCTQ